MAQKKKEAVRKATLDAAFELFSRQGYSNTTLKQIADRAGFSPANIYRYYPSKLDVLFAIFRPWLNEILDRLEEDLTTIDDPRRRLGAIVQTMWKTIPEKDNGFHGNLIQALSTLKAGEPYSRDLLYELEGRLTAMLRKCLPEDRHFMLEDDRLAHMLFMGLDGFAMGYGLVGPSRRAYAIAEDFCDMLIERDHKSMPKGEPGADDAGRPILAANK